MNNIYQYTTNSRYEIKIIKRNFVILINESPDIYFYCNLKLSRKIKLLKIDNKYEYSLINNIIKKSHPADMQDVIVKQLSLEISKEINKEIMSNLIGMIRNKIPIRKKLDRKQKNTIKNTHIYRYNKKPINKC